MALLRITDYHLLENGIEKVSWVFSKDRDRTKIIDQSLEDSINLYQWQSPLPKLPEDYTDNEIKSNQQVYYKELDTLYGHFKIYCRNYESDWYTSGPVNIALQDLVLIDHTNPIHADNHYYTLANDKQTYTNSLDLTWTTNPHNETIFKLLDIQHRDITYNQFINIQMSRGINNTLHGIAKLHFTNKISKMYLYEYNLDIEDFDIVHTDRVSITKNKNAIIFTKLGTLDTQVICNKIPCLFVIKYIS